MPQAKKLMILQCNEEGFIPKCHTCKSQIESLPYRMVEFEEKNTIVKTVFFHYFFPCWDPSFFMQIHDECKILSSGFICDEAILENQLAVRNLENNLDLWI